MSINVFNCRQRCSNAPFKPLHDSSAIKNSPRSSACSSRMNMAAITTIRYLSLWTQLKEYMSKIAKVHLNLLRQAVY